MSFLARIYYHVNYLCSLSSLTVFLMEIAILIMAGTCLFHLFFKKDYYERNINIAGVCARIIMLIAFSLELYHQMKIYSFVDSYGGKDRAVQDFINFLLFGYIVVAGIYYIFTIYTNKYKGFFYTFDIVMLSIVVLHGIVAVIFCLVVREEIEVVFYLELLVYVLMLCSFFRTYWLKKKKYYVVSLILSLMLILISIFHINWAINLPISTFIFLLVIYEILRKYLIKNKKILKLVKPIFILTCSILIAFFNPILNVWDLVSESYTYENVGTYRLSTQFTSLEDAKKIARKATDDLTSRAIVVQGKYEDFYNRYLIKIGDYDIYVDSSANKLWEVHRVFKQNWKGKFIKENIKDIKLSKSEIINKSIAYATKMGFKYNPKYMEIKVKEEKEEGQKRYNVKFYHKYMDGSIVEGEEKYCPHIIWRCDGKIYEVGFAETVFSLEDYKEICITRNEINKIINSWYKNINKPTPLHAITDISTWYLNNRVELTIDCKNGDVLMIDGNTGEVVKYYIKINQNERDIKYNKDSENNIKQDITEFDIKNMKISKEDALKIVLKKYKFFSVYGKRVKPIQIIDKNQHSEFRWMVLIMPFESQEHHIYFVDPNTGNIKPLDNYKVGVKNA